MPRVQLTITVYYPEFPISPVDDARPRENAWRAKAKKVVDTLDDLERTAKRELNDPWRGLSVMTDRLAST